MPDQEARQDPKDGAVNEVCFEVRGNPPPLKGEAVSVFSPKHGQAKRIRALLQAAQRACQEHGFVPIDKGSVALFSKARKGIADRGQLEKPHPVREFVDQPPRHFQRQTGLADPTYPGQRYPPMSLHRGLQLGDLRLAPDQARGRSPQVPRTRIQRPQRRKVRL